MLQLALVAMSMFLLSGLSILERRRSRGELLKTLVISCYVKLVKHNVVFLRLNYNSSEYKAVP